MPERSYRLGRRQEAVDRTRAAILAAARDLLAAGDGPGLSAGAVAQRAGVSRITVYNRFGSKAGLLREVAAGARREGPPPLAVEGSDPRDELRLRITHSCSTWSSDPALFRGLPASVEIEAPNDDRALAERLSSSDQLRPGCSIKEAEDVIGALTSFPVFDRLYKDGRRSPAAVTDILMRLAAGILAYS
jgi:AcrR family transcriptional regulator